MHRYIKTNYVEYNMERRTLSYDPKVKEHLYTEPIIWILWGIMFFSQNTIFFLKLNKNQICFVTLTWKTGIFFSKFVVEKCRDRSFIFVHQTKMGFFLNKIWRQNLLKSIVPPIKVKLLFPNTWWYTDQYIPQTESNG